MVRALALVLLLASPALVRAEIGICRGTACWHWEVDANGSVTLRSESDEPLMTITADGRIGMGPLASNPLFDLDIRRASDEPVMISVLNLGGAVASDAVLSATNVLGLGGNPTLQLAIYGGTIWKLYADNSSGDDALRLKADDEVRMSVIPDGIVDFPGTVRADILQIDCDPTLNDCVSEDADNTGAAHPTAPPASKLAQYAWNDRYYMKTAVTGESAKPRRFCTQVCGSDSSATCATIADCTAETNAQACDTCQQTNGAWYLFDGTTWRLVLATTTTTTTTTGTTTTTAATTTTTTTSSTTTTTIPANSCTGTNVGRLCLVDGDCGGGACNGVAGATGTVNANWGIIGGANNLAGQHFDNASSVAISVKGVRVCLGLPSATACTGGTIKAQLVRDDGSGFYSTQLGSDSADVNATTITAQMTTGNGNTGACGTTNKGQLVTFTFASAIDISPSTAPHVRVRVSGTPLATCTNIQWGAVCQGSACVDTTVNGNPNGSAYDGTTFDNRDGSGSFHADQDMHVELLR